MEVTQPNPFVEQVSGKDHEGMPILSVLLKRTYRFDDQGVCTPAPEQRPLVRELVIESPGLVLKEDLDLYPFKSFTDVVLKGNLYAPNGAKRVTARVVVGRQEKSILGLGRRQVTLSSTGKLVFSEPEPFGGIPLSYRVAYGGRDAVAEAALGNYVQDFLGKAVDPEEIDLSEASPFLYPRNPAGRGYLIKPSRPAVEALKLPYLEDPLDPLTPDRLVVERPALWPLMPVPMGTDWLSWGWFPRSAYVGAARPAEKPTAPLMEERRGWALPGLLDSYKPDPKRIARCVQGAALGLSVPLLRGGESILLEHLHPKLGKFAVRLPAERPVLMTDGRKGKMNSTEPVIHTVVLHPDENILTVVWRGCARALREYFDEELPKMPLLARWME